MAKIRSLVCRECGSEYPAKAIHVCELCFGPLEVKYNYDEIKQTISRRSIEAGPKSMWRYMDLLPVDGPQVVGPHAGLTPMVRAKNLGAYLGLDELYIKNDTVRDHTIAIICQNFDIPKFHCFGREGIKAEMIDAHDHDHHRKKCGYRYFPVELHFNTRNPRPSLS